MLIRVGKTLNFSWPKMARLGPPFLTPKIPPKKLMWVHFLHPFPGYEAHNFSGGPKQGVLGESQKFMLKKFLCFYGPLAYPFKTETLN